MVEAMREQNPDGRLNNEQIEILQEGIFFNGIEPASRPVSSLSC